MPASTHMRFKSSEDFSLPQEVLFLRFAKLQPPSLAAHFHSLARSNRTKRQLSAGETRWLEHLKPESSTDVLGAGYNTQSWLFLRQTSATTKQQCENA